MFKSKKIVRPAYLKEGDKVALISPAYWVMLTAHLAEYDIPVCCGFPVGDNSCIPMMVGAPCVFEVSPEKSVLTFNVEGERKTYSLEGASEQLFKK